jgi:hypothetical protein
MKAKLTLSIEKELIETAKQYARENGRSLSELVELFLKKIYPSPNSESSTLNEPLPPAIAKLKGSLNPPLSNNYKAELEQALIERYEKRSN